MTQTVAAERQGSPTARAKTTRVTGPGVYDLPQDVYHADPVPGGSLSSTGARKLLPPSCPALFDYDRQHPSAPRPVFEEGTAAHRLALGTGPELVLVDRDRWDTNAVKQEIAEIRERGAIPLKRAEYERVHAMAAALRKHPWAGALFAEGSGKPEQTLIWPEKATLADGSRATVWCRALVDWLRYPDPARRYLLADYKTCVSAAPAKVERAIAEHGYHIQLAWYLAGARRLGLADQDARGLLVMQEKTPPYLVTVVEPDRTAMRLGAMRMREAIDLCAQCTAEGRWPGYADDVVIAELPPWETRDLDGDIW